MKKCIGENRCYAAMLHMYQHLNWSRVKDRGKDDRLVMRSKTANEKVAAFSWKKKIDLTPLSYIPYTCNARLFILTGGN